MILVDSNVPMYLVGGDHPHKMGSRNALERLISAGERLVTDAEVLQEILHRYSAIDRRDTIQSAFDALLGVVDQVLPIDRSIVEAAKGIVVGRTKLSARDAIHYAVMQAHDITRILSFDSGFDGLPGVERLRA